MATSIITSHHNLERDVNADILNGAPHVVHCRTCKVGPMSLGEARAHAEQPLQDGETMPTYTLFTLWP